jgi:hypothetical protein
MVGGANLTNVVNVSASPRVRANAYAKGDRKRFTRFATFTRVRVSRAAPRAPRLERIPPVQDRLQARLCPSSSKGGGNEHERSWVEPS